MAGTYDFSYAPGTPYAHAVELVGRWRRPGGTVLVDLGCGYGAIAEPVRALGLTYLGIDQEPAGVASIVERGGEAAVGDISDPAALFGQLDDALGGRPVAAFTMLDAVEHLPNASDVLVALSRYAHAAGEVPLIVSIPNVSHRDLGIKLLLGRWDVTPTGLLDATHVRFFSPRGLATTMAAAGWSEADAHDFDLEASDQHFPADCVALEADTPIGALLRTLRHTAAPGATTNQFVRAYRPETTRVPDHAPRAPTSPSAPFLSIIVRSEGTRRATLEDLVLSLAGQTCDDWELVLVVPGAGAARRVEHAVAGYADAVRARVEIVDAAAVTDRPWSLPGAANLGIDAARGRYVAVLDDDHVAFGDWVEMLRSAASQHPGRVIHVGVASQRVVATPGAWQRHPEDVDDTTAGPTLTPTAAIDAYDVVDRPRLSSPPGIGLLELLGAPAAPACAYALPRSFFSDLGERFDEDVAGAADWELAVRAIARCGVRTAGVVGLMRRLWDGAPQRIHDPGGAGRPHGMDYDAWAAALSALDRRPLLLDRGMASQLAGLAARAGSGATTDRGPDAIPATSPTTSPATYQSLRASVRNLALAKADAEAAVAAMRASTSWRVTAPMRRAARLLRRAARLLRTDSRG